MPLVNHPFLPRICMAIAAFAGGALAFVLGSPMPFLIGGVAGSALFVVTFESGDRHVGKLHPWLRPGAIAVIGTMIGSKVSPDLLGHLPAFWPSILAVFPFILLAHAGGYLILRRVGKLPVTDAYFSSMPGGLVEAVMLGEKAGADLRIMTVQHFIRVLAIVVVVPLLFFVLTGEKVGSAAGNESNNAIATPFGLLDFAVLAIITSVGLIVGRAMKVPASHLLGPMLLSGAVSLSGVVTIEVPAWLLHTAQFVVGTTLGAQFSGINRALLKRGLALGGLTTSYLLALGLLFAWVVLPFVPARLSEMFISFTAGGLTEMGLIALTLELSPIIVVMHHLVRIFLTISVGNFIYQRFFRNR